jgi:hypothetical protein
MTESEEETLNEIIKEVIETKKPKPPRRPKKNHEKYEINFDEIITIVPPEN